jgi:hypothetical protein
MNKRVATAAVLFFTIGLSAGFSISAFADECPSAPKSPRQKCLKAAYNWCNNGNGFWDNPGKYTVPPGPKDTCPSEAAACDSGYHMMDGKCALPKQQASQCKSGEVYSSSMGQCMPK